MCEDDLTAAVCPCLACLLSSSPDLFMLQGGQDNVQDYRLAVQRWMPYGQDAGRSRNDRRFRCAEQPMVRHIIGLS